MRCRGSICQARLTDEPPRDVGEIFHLQMEEKLLGGFAEIAIFNAPIGNGPADPVDELAHRNFTLRRPLLPIEIFRNDDFCREQRPGLGDLHIFLLKDNLAGIVSDLRRSAFPLNLLKGLNSRIAEHSLQLERIPLRR